MTIEYSSYILWNLQLGLFDYSTQEGFSRLAWIQISPNHLEIATAIYFAPVKITNYIPSKSFLPL